MFTQRFKREQREEAVRASLVIRLKEAVQSVVQWGGTSVSSRYNRKNNSGTSRLTPVLGHTDNTNALCSVLEALFIHGLRDSLGERMSSLLGSDPDRMPVPNFWPVLLIISHRDLIEQVNELTFISSEVGRSRAWVRLALNSGQICSYLGVLLQDTRTLKEYYRPTAFFRDGERADIMLSVLQPVSSLTLGLATNAAVLNTWTQTPLVLAGLWAPSIQGVASDPVLAATDVASTVYDEPTGVEINVPASPVTDQMFDLIIGVTPETSFINDYMEKQAVKSTNIKEEKCSDESVNNDQLGELSIKLEESHQEEPVFDAEDITSQEPKSEEAFDAVPADSKNQLDTSITSTVSSRSYMREFSEDSLSHSLIEGSSEYTRIFSGFASAGPFTNMPCLGQPTTFSPNDISNFSEISNESSPSETAEKLDYEVVPRDLPSEEDMKKHLPLLTQITNEAGLDSQLYQCHQCSAYVGMIYGKPRVCSYDSKYYCYECHQDERALIPARVVHNWDFNLYSVCCANAKWLSAIHHQPLINLRTVNSKLYSHVEDLAELQVLRTQLLYVRAYLFTCRTGSGDKFRKMLWPREHLYEHVHLYSLADLQLVAVGQLVAQLRRAFIFGRDHILQCEVCAPRGFICELCTENDIIYPFELGKTYTCRQCQGVSHGACVRQQPKCPRCTRIAARKYTTQEH